MAGEMDEAKGRAKEAAGALTDNDDLKAEGKVRIEVYSVTGKLISVPFNGTVQSGKQSIIWDASGVASGAYLAKAVDANGTLLGALKLTKQ